VLKANTQEHPDAAAPFGIQGIPTFMIFGGGQEVDRQVGLPSLAQLASWIDQRLEPGN
jgi:thioredoxin-like negative regulator of GroEL